MLDFSIAEEDIIIAELALLIRSIDMQVEVAKVKLFKLYVEVETLTRKSGDGVTIVHVVIVDGEEAEHVSRCSWHTSITSIDGLLLAKQMIR